MIQRLVLLPGMDGTGELFSGLVKALPELIKKEIVSYPVDRCLSYAELASFVPFPTHISEPFVLVAESFSTPLAINYAATNQANLKGLVICAGFATSPVRGWLRFVCSSLAPILFYLPLPKFVIKFLLIGPNAPSSLLEAVKTVISSVQPKVLLSRVRAVFECDARAELSQIEVPILYLQAKQDRLVHSWCLAEIQRLKPQTTIATITGPHLLFQREPQQAADAIIRFVQQIV